MTTKVVKTETGFLLITDEPKTEEHRHIIEKLEAATGGKWVILANTQYEERRMAMDARIRELEAFKAKVQKVLEKFDE
jgi:uncharacterized Fe-S center protein